MFGPAVFVTEVAFAVFICVPEFGRNDDFVLIRRQRFADKFLVGKGTVAFRRVKKGNTVVNGLMQQFNQFFFSGCSPQ